MLDQGISWYSTMFTLECGVFSCSTPYCGFCVNLLQPLAWTEDTYIGYDIVTNITILVWFSLKMGLRTLDESSVQPMLSDWGDQFLCNKMLRHYEDNAFTILSGVSGCDWHWVHQPCGLDIWSELCALLSLRLFIVLSSGDVSWWLQWTIYYNGTTVLSWLTLRMSNRTFCSPSWFEAERCYLYVKSYFGDGT